MKINLVNNYSFTGENKSKNNLKSLGYPLLSATGALVGYSIKLKDLEGADMVNDMGHVVSLRKTKVPNILGKWKNALAGAFVGTAVMLIADLIMNNRKSKN